MLKILGESRCLIISVLQKICLSKTFQVPYRGLRSCERKLGSQSCYKRVIGIDLGSTHTCMSVIKGRVPEIIKDWNDDAIISSAVIFGPNGYPDFGIGSKTYIGNFSGPPVSSMKRLIGRKFDDYEFQKEMLRTSSHIVRAPNGEALIDVAGGTHSLVEIASVFFQELKATAETYLEHSVKSAVITVPFDFLDLQKQAILRAGKEAGLNVLCFMEEPLAAALAYGCGIKDEIIAVYDLGGRTFNITIYEIRNGIFKVKSQYGDNFLGGEDFDILLLSYIEEEFKKEGLDLLQNVLSVNRLKLDVEEAKCALSDSEKAFVDITCDRGEFYEYTCAEITRQKFESLVSDLISRTIEICRKALCKAKMNAPEIEKVILVGGMTKMPKVQNMVQEGFKNTSNMCTYPDEAVAMGAAILGKALSDSSHDLIRHRMPLPFVEDGNLPLTITAEHFNITTTVADILRRQNAAVADSNRPTFISEKKHENV